MVEHGLSTVLALAETAEQPDQLPFRRERFSTLHRQAALQVQSRTTGLPTHRQLAPARGAGYARLPDPDPGDVFFDLEGDPYVGDDGLEYLWGWTASEAGYEYAWAHDGAGERAALERFVDRITELRRQHPDMHVYHYAPHERSKLRSLAVKYATREDEVDDLLRCDVLVDLYSVVREGLQVGEESYSLKKLERHHGFQRLERRVREGGGSIVAYETWLETGDDELLEAIRAYNEDDCRSTASLRRWLLADMRPEAADEFGVDFADLRIPEPQQPPSPPAWLPDVEALAACLVDGLPFDTSLDSEDDAERRLLSYLLLYHHRENKPQWWRYFDLCGKSVEDLIDERDALAGLERDERIAPMPHKRSLDYVFRFPAQEFRLDVGQAEDPTTGETVNVVAVGDDYVTLRCGKKKPAPAPRALIAGGPPPTTELRGALVELARGLLNRDARFPAAHTLLRREPPDPPSDQLGEDALATAALALDRSVLPIQGPPGTGKTYRGAHGRGGARTRPPRRAHGTQPRGGPEPARGGRASGRRARVRV